MNLTAMTISVMAVLQFSLILLLMPTTLIYAEEHDQNVSRSSARLILKTRSGFILEREARGAVSVASEAGTPTPASSKENKRIRNNKKSIKRQDHLQHGATSTGGRKSGFKKLGDNGNNNSQHNRQIFKQQQKHQQQHSQQEQQDGNEQGLKPKVKTSENNKSSTCRYAKTVWSDCDGATNMRTRTLSLKKGEANCLPTRTIQKKCKKDCHYEKGAWSDCIAGQITREDKLRADSSTMGTGQCDPVRTVYKKCNPGAKQRGVAANRSGNKERKRKEKGTRRTPTEV
ncbi:uncharacterized protein Dwil_GK16544 [Drosophila willistoni]|uniref:Pleiotrophin/Midkine C-terminal domain-containing protein n=1 Tax=Drosophila willistoni TaxID=7260 RepID=B4MN88_DROWI|nr:uncharacterized protein LOC6638659 [Drosophila willistoni]EDW73644.1 uncharacterized protein Dwil_GK16544 [Drosophila willistoni]